MRALGWLGVAEEGVRQDRLRIHLSIPSHGLSLGGGFCTTTSATTRMAPTPATTVLESPRLAADTHTTSAVLVASACAQMFAVCLVYLPYRSARLATFCRYYYYYILACPPHPSPDVGSPDDCYRWNGCRSWSLAEIPGSASVTGLLSTPHSSAGHTGLIANPQLGGN